MGVGFSIDLVVCSALGCDLYDCVFPTRTAVCKVKRNTHILSTCCFVFIEIRCSID